MNINASLTVQKNPISLYEDNGILMPKPDKDLTRKLHVSYEHRCKTSQQNTSKPNQEKCKKDHMP
jgi:hypothetical protein